MGRMNLNGNITEICYREDYEEISVSVDVVGKPL